LMTSRYAAAGASGCRPNFSAWEAECDRPLRERSNVLRRKRSKRRFDPLIC
jgi:hypothetical protein